MEDVGRYRVTRRLGQGGMAEVFEGVALGSEGFQRRVAVKRMKAENAAEPAFGRMFLDEARIASQLHHANIVGVLDFGVADGHPFQVLEYVDGADVNRLVAMAKESSHPLTAPMALAICTDIAHALDHAHAARDEDGRSLGIVHRDVSPANILVSWNGDVKLSDFGIAFARGRAETTSAGYTKGTLLYMAPEQILRGELDGRTDVFALGCVLHALIAGRSPLAVDNAMADLIAGTPLQISRDLPDDIYDLVARATRLAKRDRFASAGEMAAALGKALARRIEGDARTLMQEWLAKVRAPAAAPQTAGKLDALLGVNLVFSGLRKSLPPDRRSLPPERRTPQPEESTQSRGSRSPWFLLAVIAPIAVATVVVLVWRSASQSVAAASVVDAAPAPAPAPQVVRLDAGVPPSPPAPDARVAALADAPPTPTPTPRPRPQPQPRPTPPVPLPTSEGDGVLAIGGGGALRAEIFVDGKSRGHAPRALTLPTGEHEVLLVLPSGERVGPKVMRVTETHTPSAPLRWVVP